MARYAINSTITSPGTGLAVPDALVTIRVNDRFGALAPVYEARTGGGQIANPLPS